jgi:hypothetical protein
VYARNAGHDDRACHQWQNNVERELDGMLDFPGKTADEHHTAYVNGRGKSARKSPATPERRIILVVHNMVRFVEPRDVQQPMDPISNTYTAMLLFAAEKRTLSAIPVETSVLHHVKNQKLEQECLPGTRPPTRTATVKPHT